MKNRRNSSKMHSQSIGAKILIFGGQLENLPFFFRGTPQFYHRNLKYNIGKLGSLTGNVLGVYTLKFSLYLSKECPESWAKFWRESALLVESFVANCLGAHSIWRASSPYGQSFGLNFDTPCLLLAHGSAAGWKWYKIILFLAAKLKKMKTGKFPKIQ